MGYRLPSNTDWVSCSWQCHKDRNPPSSEPGTDYGAAYGTPTYAVEDGTVVSIQTYPSYATGRFVEYRLDDGRTTRSLHMSEVWVSVGERVKRGQQIGKVGGSGNGDDWYYGPHDHQTLWPGSAWAAPTIDFALYVGPADVPPPEEDAVIFYHREDYDARHGGTALAPGNGMWLNINKGAPTSQASNVVGGIGNYSLTAHVYAEGRPGDRVRLTYYWDDTTSGGPHSPHYIEDIEIPASGIIRQSVEFKRGVARGYAVYLQLTADGDNEANVKVTLLDSDAFLFA